MLVGPDKTTMKVRQLGYWVGMMHESTCMSDMPVFQTSITTKSPNYQYPIWKTTGNDHCGRTLPQVKITGKFW